MCVRKSPLFSSQVEINFNKSGMTYAERLLLKRHRRNDVVGALHSGLPADVRPFIESPRDATDNEVLSSMYQFGYTFILTWKIKYKNIKTIYLCKIRVDVFYGVYERILTYTLPCALG